jgi:hypothetical protein
VARGTREPAFSPVLPALRNAVERLPHELHLTNPRSMAAPRVELLKVLIAAIEDEAGALLHSYRVVLAELFSSPQRTAGAGIDCWQATLQGCVRKGKLPQVEKVDLVGALYFCKEMLHVLQAGSKADPRGTFFRRCTSLSLSNRASCC